MSHLASLRLSVLALLVAGASIPGFARKAAGERTVVPNDNRVSAGRLRHDTLKVRLAVVMARWRPESESDSGIVVAAFAEEGKAPTIPAPLLRVPEGTVIDATIRNGLADSALTLRGFVGHPGSRADTLVVRPGETVHVRFAAGAPGTYWYGASPGSYNPGVSPVERETSLGAFVVDPRGGSPPDRVFVLNIWSGPIDSANSANALAINGRSWPWTERIETNLGDTLRWRWVNTTIRNHPMHLHGFYFRTESRGNGVRDSAYPDAARPLVVTHDVRPFETFSLTWSPDRPGNWLYHCHIGFHVIAGAADLHPEDSTHREMSGDPRRHMAGLVLGITVRTPSAWVKPARPNPRRLDLFVQEAPRRGRAARALGFVLQRGASPPRPDSVETGSSVLVLTRGEPTDITVHNRIKEPAIIHWHGIELESYSDGVSGWSGAGRLVAPIIQPGDSFVARLTLPRAGTFMYHTHFNDVEQLSSGLYGGIVVLEPGQRFDPATDHLYVGGWDGPEDPPHLLINGDSIPPALELAAGVPHRFRFVNIGVAGGYWPSLRREGNLLTWRSVAKDGADLPPALAIPRRAQFRIQVGETADFMWTPEPGTYTLSLGTLVNPAWVQRIIVRAGGPP